MAGMPPAVIQRANEILEQLEEKHVGDAQASGEPHTKDLTKAVQQLSAPKMQLSIFDAHSETFDEIRTLLNNIDINRLTPVEALMKLNEIKGKLK
jgi:DNA mismatch repair protein MutS